MRYLFEPPAVPTLDIAGSESLFPVRRIYCVGRNYAEHAREMGAEPSREPPFFFAKPADAVVRGGGAVPYPPCTLDLQHEVELVVALDRGGTDIPQARALDCVFGYVVGLDLTRRDLQAQAKRNGQPWDMAKGFDHSAPLGSILPVSAGGHPVSGAIVLEVNGSQRQKGDLRDMSWSVAQIIERLSRCVALAAGDLIFTGTPAGVGPLRVGDRVSARIEGVGELDVTIVAPAC
jgi:fumarylpyruvate hydrolase